MILITFVANFSFSFSKVKANSSFLFNPATEVKYSLNYTYIIQSDSNNEANIYAWIPEIKNWSAGDNTEIDDFVQRTHDIQTDVIGQLDNFTESDDIYNNSYDYYEAILSSSMQQFKVSYSQPLWLKSQEWNYSKSISLEDYNQNTSLYNFYTSSQPYVESNDTEIIEIANEILVQDNTVYEVAKASYLKVIDLLDYTLKYDNAQGAKAALTSGEGDCSEYASLLVAILRAAGIPARKAIGYVLVEGEPGSTVPNYRLEVDDSFNYNSSEANFPGHAWVQYYVPNYGWVSADPTWGESLFNVNRDPLIYFDYWDSLHIITSVGDYYGEGIQPALKFESGVTGIPEFPYIYLWVYATIPTLEKISYSYDISIQVSDVINPMPENEVSFETLLIFFTSGGFLIIFFVLGIFFSKKRRR